MPRRTVTADDASPRPTRGGRGARAAEDPAIRVLRQFRQVFNAVKSHFQQLEKTVGLGGSQVWALSIVREHPGIGIGALARAMAIHQSTASNLVRTMAERGFVDVAKDGADKRAVHLRLLPAGMHVLKSVPGPFAGLLPDALRSLDEPTLRRLQEDLGKLIVALDADARGASILLSDM